MAPTEIIVGRIPHVPCRGSCGTYVKNTDPQRTCRPCLKLADKAKAARIRESKKAKAEPKTPKGKGTAKKQAPGAPKKQRKLATPMPMHDNNQLALNQFDAKQMIAFVQQLMAAGVKPAAAAAPKKRKLATIEEVDEDEETVDEDTDSEAEDESDCEECDANEDGKCKRK